MVFLVVVRRYLFHWELKGNLILRLLMNLNHKLNPLTMDSSRASTKISVASAVNMLFSDDKYQ